MQVVGKYHGIDIVEDLGYLSPIVDLTVCERNLTDIMAWIDDFLSVEPIKPKIEMDWFIIGEYVMREKYLKN